MPEITVLPSKLGTREYWEAFYKIELKNFKEIADIGEIWFGQLSVDRMVGWIQANSAKSDAILDIGCGNGHFLGELYGKGFQKLIGVDYSDNSVNLARSIYKDMKFEHLDVIADVSKHAQMYSLCTDKGTFDAISLSTEKDYPYFLHQSPCQTYVDNIASILVDGGKLLITSCNWTEDELRTMFERVFEFDSRVKYPTFQFGGVSGQKVVTIALRKRKL